MKTKVLLIMLVMVFALFISPASYAQTVKKAFVHKVVMNASGEVSAIFLYFPDGNMLGKYGLNPIFDPVVNNRLVDFATLALSSGKPIRATVDALPPVPLDLSVKGTLEKIVLMN